MTRWPTFDEIFAVMASASVGEVEARVILPANPQVDDLETRFAIALNLLLDDLAQRNLELTESEARKSAILKSALDAIVSMDQDGYIVEFNPAAEKMFDYTCQDVIGKPMADTIIPPRLREAHSRGLAHYLATGEGPVIGKRLELTGMRADGTEFPVELTVTRVNFSGPPLFTGYLRDISYRKRAEEELKHSFELLRKTDDERRTLLAHLVRAQEDERKRIASDVHDDSIQVMAAVGIRLGMLKRQLNDSEQQARITKLEEAVQLSIGRLRHLLFQLAPPALDLDGLAAAIRAYLDEAFSETDVKYNLETFMAPEPSRETRTLIYRIAQEALSNVRKHAQARSVAVRLEDSGAGLMVQIRDDGVGYSPTDSEMPQPGHMGLVSMRERAEMLGGWFRIEGAPGAGTTVEFWVPTKGPAIVESGQP